MFDCKLDEAEVGDLKQYKNLREFFTRKLRPGARQVHDRLPLVSVRRVSFRHVTVELHVIKSKKHNKSILDK